MFIIGIKAYSIVGLDPDHRMSRPSFTSTGGSMASLILV